MSGTSQCVLDRSSQPASFGNCCEPSASSSKFSYLALRAAKAMRRRRCAFAGESVRWVAEVRLSYRRRG